jgi:hypothetical protein
MFPHTASRGFGPHVIYDAGRGRIAAALGEVVRFLRLCRAIAVLGVCVCVSAAANRARAFTDPSFFGKPAKIGGTEGRWFTGAPTDGYGCDVCHGDKTAEKLVVEGLPKNGYVPGKEYEVRIAWPEFAARTRLLYDSVPSDQIPRASLVAELVAESAEDSGQILQRPLQQATPQELCHTTQKRLGALVFRQAPRLETKSVSVCDAVNTTRCLVAVRGCGSEEVRFTWIAPQRWQGTIWFSTSFVATDRISKTPADDATSEVTIQLAPAGSPGYVSELQQSCAVSRVGITRRGSLAPFGLLALLVISRARRPRAGDHK